MGFINVYLYLLELFMDMEIEVFLMESLIDL